MALSMTMPFTGCAERSFADLRAGLEKEGHYIEGVPFFRQEEGSCGPAALASVVSFWGRQADLDRIIARVYLPELRGTLPMDMEKYLRDGGFETASSAGTMDALQAMIRRNAPVICLLDLGFGLYHRPHYITVIGFDEAGKAVIVHDGRTANKVIGYGKFMREWGRAGNWMLVALPGTFRTKDSQ